MAEHKIYRSSTTAPVNIAVIKYWGKRDPALNLPTNSSLSVTLSQADLRTHTTASCSASFSGSDTLLLNSAPQEISSARPVACLKALRCLRASLETANDALPKLSSYTLRIVSENNFPTAAGLASSAAGFAALVRAMADLYQLPQSATELSLIARQGSGSACRSLMGGYVAWDKGTKDDGSDSVARVVAPRSHWPEMQALILVVSADKKGISSTSGMQATVKTSALFQKRSTEVVPLAMVEMEKAILARDFQLFGRITMRESNSFHATCLDTEPPIFYLNDVSRVAIRAVEEINTKAGKIIAAYTFDAGPNAVIYYLQEHRDVVEGSFEALLKGQGTWNQDEGRAASRAQASVAFEGKVAQMLADGVSRVILTGIGEGPISVETHLIDESGEPVKS